MESKCEVNFEVYECFVSPDLRLNSILTYKDISDNVKNNLAGRDISTLIFKSAVVYYAMTKGVEYRYTGAKNISSEIKSAIYSSETEIKISSTILELTIIFMSFLPAITLYSNKYTIEDLGECSSQITNLKLEEQKALIAAAEALKKKELEKLTEKEINILQKATESVLNESIPASEGIPVEVQEMAKSVEKKLAGLYMLKSRKIKGKPKGDCVVSSDKLGRSVRKVGGKRVNAKTYDDLCARFQTGTMKSGKEWYKIDGKFVSKQDFENELLSVST